MHKIYYFFRGDTKKEALRIVNAAKIRMISYASGKEAPGLVSCFICPAISFGVFWKKGENNDTNSNKYVTEFGEFRIFLQENLRHMLTFIFDRRIIHIM